MLLRLQRELKNPPQPVCIDGFTIRSARLPHDIARWLALRESAIADVRPTPGPWSEDDFRREFTAQEGFRNEWMWVAESHEMTKVHHNDDKILSGTVTLMVRRLAENAAARVHWLLVHPNRRRKGLAGAMMATLERACWDAGIRRISLETHRNWHAAVAFYRYRGYA